MSAKHYWIVLASDYEPQMEEGKTARAALTLATSIFPGGFRRAVGIIRMDALRPGPQTRIQAVCAGLDPDTAGPTRARGPFTAYIGQPAAGGATA